MKLKLKGEQMRAAMDEMREANGVQRQEDEHWLHQPHGENWGGLWEVVH